MIRRNHAVYALVAIFAALGLWAGSRPTTPPAAPQAQPLPLVQANCGVERWAVKTLSDSAAASVSAMPMTTTVDALRAAPVSVKISSGTTRVPGVETVVYQVQALLVSAKLESDGDIHLVITMPSDATHTMIVEFPDDSCVRAAAPSRRAAMAQARKDFIGACGLPTPSFARLRGTATITGVLFFDLPHNQAGAAPNFVELHPVIGFQSGCRQNTGGASGQISGAAVFLAERAGVGKP